MNDRINHEEHFALPGGGIMFRDEALAMVKYLACFKETSELFHLGSVSFLRFLGVKVTVHYKRFPVTQIVHNSKVTQFPVYDSGLAWKAQPYSPVAKFNIGVMDDTPFTSYRQMWIAFPRGGEVSVLLTFPNGDTVGGESKCHMLDNFDRLKGLRKAIVRTQWWKHL